MLGGCQEDKAGGSAGAGPTVPPASEWRTDLLFGYYGTLEGTVAEVADHANMVWVMGWGAGYVADLTEAQARGIPNVVLGLPFNLVYEPDAEQRVRGLLGPLAAQGLLRDVVALYPMDEPDLNGHTVEQVVAANVMLRRVMAEFPQLKDMKLAVIYAAPRAFGQWPGVETYDWVGFDDYDVGDAALSNDEWRALKAHLRPDQRILLVPGGACPWEHDPLAFFAQAQIDKQVVAIVAFLWFDQWDSNNRVNCGIRSSRVKQQYIDVGTHIKFPKAK